MNKAISIFTFLLLAAFAMKAQEGNPVPEIVFSGVVVDADSLQPLPGSNIIVNRTRGTSTDLDGNFTIVVKPADSVMISQLGYVHYLFIIPEDFQEMEFHVTVAMQRDTVMLDEVQIYPWPSRDQFKKEFLGLDVEQEDKVELNLAKLKEDKSVSKTGASAISMSSIFKYKRFYKDEADKMEVRKLEQNKKYNDYLLAKFDEAAKKFTQVKEEELDEFRNYCNLTEDFIKNATEYDMASAVVKCYRDFSGKN